MSGSRRWRRSRTIATAECRLFVTALKLVNFRNYVRAELPLDQRPVVLVGDNGAGKTNLLEAVSLLGPGSGLRARPLAELPRKDGPGSFAIAARVMSRHGEVEISTGWEPRPESEAAGRIVRIADKEASPGALGEQVKLVWLIPAMDGLFTGPASERRRFLDRLMLAIDPKMRGPRARYDRAMRQRNRLFQLREGSPALFAGARGADGGGGHGHRRRPPRCGRAAHAPHRGGGGQARRRPLPLGGSVPCRHA